MCLMLFLLLLFFLAVAVDDFLINIFSLFIYLLLFLFLGGCFFVCFWGVEVRGRGRGWGGVGAFVCFGGIEGGFV